MDEFAPFIGCIFVAITCLFTGIHIALEDCPGGLITEYYSEEHFVITHLDETTCVQRIEDFPHDANVAGTLVEPETLNHQQ